MESQLPYLNGAGTQDGPEVRLEQTGNKASSATWPPTAEPLHLTSVDNV